MVYDAPDDHPEVNSIRICSGGTKEGEATEVRVTSMNFMPEPELRMLAARALLNGVRPDLVALLDKR